MITVELVRAVVNAPLIAADVLGETASQAVSLVVGEDRVDRIVYVPQLALVVVWYAGQGACIVPVRHAWHMTTTAGDDVLRTLAWTVD